MHEVELNQNKLNENKNELFVQVELQFRLETKKNQLSLSSIRIIITYHVHMNKIDQFFSLIVNEYQIEKMSKLFLVQTNVLLLHQKIDQYKINLQLNHHHSINSTK